MKDCLVTGGCGFIGSHLVEGLLARGHSVRVLDDLSTGYEANLAPFLAKDPGRLQLIRGSITKAGEVRQALAGCDTVFHLAALPSVTKSVENPMLSHDICATGTMQLLDEARRAKVRRLVYAASSSAYGDQPGLLRTEADPLLPLSPYAAAKLAGEHYCKCCTAVYGIETVRLRFFNVFGPRQDAKSPYSGVIALFIAAMNQGKVPIIFGDGLQTRDFVYVENVVQALILAADASAASGNVYNIGNGQGVTLIDLMRDLNELLATSIQPKFEPARAGDIRHSAADISLARRDLGYEPGVSFREGLARTLKWAQGNGK